MSWRQIGLHPIIIINVFTFTVYNSLVNFTVDWYNIFICTFTENILCHKRLCQTSLQSELGSLLRLILGEMNSMNQGQQLQSKCAEDIPPARNAQKHYHQFLVQMLFIYFIKNPPLVFALTTASSGYVPSTEMYSMYLANPSLSQMSFHHTIVTKLPNH